MPKRQPAPSTWSHVAIIGVGNLGGSVGKALRNHHPKTKVVGFARSPETRRLALELECVHEMADSLADCVQGANLVVVGVPVGSVVAVVREILPLLLPGTVVTDLGSTKQTIVSALRKTPPGVTFVGGHPLAGSEESGPRAARADLFQGCRVILTPMPATPLPVIEQLSSWWRSLGAGQITSLSPKEHDRIVAAISHVPHLLAAALASATPAETLPWAASGWKDTTRIAAGPVDVWNDIFLANRKNLLHGLANVERVLASFRKTLENNGQEHRLKLLLKKAKDQRDAVAD